MEKPSWNRGDTVRSIRGIFLLGKRALAELINKVDRSDKNE